MAVLANHLRLLRIYADPFPSKHVLSLDYARRISSEEQSHHNDRAEIFPVNDVVDVLDIALVTNGMKAAIGRET